MSYYKNRIIQLANKFAAKLKEKDLFRGEFTDELKEYFQAIHENLLILYKRVISSSMPDKEKADINISIANISKLLKPGRFLRFDFDREYNVIHDAISKMNSIKYQLKAYHLTNEEEIAKNIIHDLEQSFSLFMSQDQIVDRSIMVNPTRMFERVNKNPDQFSYEDISPDFPGSEE